MTSNLIDLVHLKEELDTLLECADVCQREIDDLLETYGSGVRPGWVSADLSRAMVSRDWYMDKAELLRKQIDYLSNHDN